MTQVSPDAPPAGPALIAVPVVGILAGLIGMVVPPIPHALPIGLTGWTVALLLAVAGVALGTSNAKLLPVLRHTYNLHYIVLLPLMVFTWTLDFAPTLGGPVWLTQALRGLMIGSAAAAACCLAASLFSLPRSQLTSAWIAAGLPFALAGAGGLPGPLLAGLFASAGLLTWHGKNRAAAQLTNGQLGAIGSISFLAISLLALLGLGQLLAMILAPLFQDISAPPPPPPPVVEILRLEAARLGLGLLASVVAFAVSFAWPHRRVSGIVIGSASASLLVAALVGGRPLDSTSLPALLAMMVGLIGATALAAELPRSRRWAGASLAAAVGAILGIEFLGGSAFHHPMVLAAQWFAEASALIVLLLLVYSTGARKIRLWSEGTSSHVLARVLPQDEIQSESWSAGT